jgi:hypothetical protein
MKRGLRLITRIALTIWLLAPGAILSAQQTVPDGFKPLDESTPRETVPAAPLVFIAYSLAWLVLAGYTWILWRRLDRAERDLADLRRRK